MAVPTMTAVWVALAGSLGAVTRFVLDSALRSRFPARLPWPTALINVTGSWLLGILVGAALFHGDGTSLWVTIAGVGFCGGYTTFSTTSVDTVRLIVGRRYGAALVLALGTLAATVAAAAAGLWTATWW